MQKHSRQPAKMRLSVRLKLLLPFALVLGIAVLVAVPLMNLVRLRLEQEADERLEQSAEAFTQILGQSKSQAELISAFTASRAEVQAIGRDRSLAAEVLAPIKTELDLLELSYYRDDYRSGMPTLYYNGPEVDRQNSVSQRSLEVRDNLILAAIEARSVESAIVNVPQGLQIISVSPVYLEENLNGIIVAVLFIDSNDIAAIGEVLNVDIALVRDNGIVVSNIDRSSNYELILQGGFLDNPEASTNISYASDNLPRRMHAHELIIDGEFQGHILLVRDLADVLAVEQRIQLVLLGFLGIMSFIMLVYSLGVVVNFANPLTHLADAANKVSLGNFKKRVTVPNIAVEDEVIDLSRNFNNMTAQLEALYKDLEDKVAQRTEELKVTLGELEVKRDEALDANRTKSLFLANMSHELRTPLNAIIGYSEMLEEEAQDYGYTDIVPDLRKIQSAGTHLLALINDILDLSKIEAGKIELYLEQFDVENLLDEIAMTIQPIIEKKGSKLALQYENELGMMYGDVTRMRQIIMNLLSNAAKFTQEGTVTIQARRYKNEEKQDYFEIKVKDSGIGMNTKQLSRIFSEFTQADASTTRKYGGTGLGLPISRHFVELMGGTISVSSIEGEGSTFSVNLPAHVKQVEKRATREMPAIKIEDTGD